MNDFRTIHEMKNLAFVVSGRKKFAFIAEWDVFDNGQRLGVESGCLGRVIIHNTTTYCGDFSVEDAEFVARSL